MGHYDDAQARFEEERDSRWAEVKGMTVEEYRAKVAHDDKMRRGRAFFAEQNVRDDLINYYLQHKEPAA